MINPARDLPYIVTASRAIPGGRDTIFRQCQRRQSCMASGINIFFLFFTYQK